MKRRQFIKASIGCGMVVGLIGGGVAWFSISSNKGPLTVDAALAKLKSLYNRPVLNTGEWDVYQIFSHCAQSVEYSMIGFPEHNSDLFKKTVGQAVFSIFSSKGKMTHSLSEPIPGAPDLAKGKDVKIALNRLEKSLVAFKQYEGKLLPHFAYGELSKKEYEVAHVMHLYNHLQEINS
ncbi:MAG: hypothetical protein ACI9UT_002018 [Flavobacteriales bacterium]|jgi:hypothetical protein